MKLFAALLLLSLGACASRDYVCQQVAVDYVHGNAPICFSETGQVLVPGKLTR